MGQHIGGVSRAGPPGCPTVIQPITGDSMPMQPIRSSLSDAQRLFSLRIAYLDYYLAPPIPGVDITFSSLEGTVVDTVPIVRVFGSTPAGQRVCLHLHQVSRDIFPWSADVPCDIAIMHGACPSLSLVQTVTRKQVQVVLMPVAAGCRLHAHTAVVA